MEGNDFHHFVAQLMQSQLRNPLEDPDPLKPGVQILAFRLNLRLPQIGEMLLRNGDVLDLSLRDKPNVRYVAKSIVHIRTTQYVALL